MAKLYGDAAKVAKVAQALGASKSKAEGAVKSTLAKSSGGSSSTPVVAPAKTVTGGFGTTKYYSDGTTSNDAQTSPQVTPTTKETPVAPIAPITPAEKDVSNLPGKESLDTTGYGLTPTDKQTNPLTYAPGSLESMTVAQANAAGKGADYTALYRKIAGQQPTGVDVMNPADSKNAVTTLAEQGQGMPPPTGGQEIMDLFDTDENKDLLNLEKMYKDFYTPQNQKTSLMDTYREMVSSMGIDDINEELIDAKNIIEGTEDDIRTEITKAGGFATESQVQGMTNARNKSLIKNYNTLLETKNALTDQLGNMMQYAQADRQYAAQQFESRMNFEMKKIEYGQQAKQYANAQLGKIVDKVGYAGLLSMAGGDAYTTSKIEKALGLGQGGLTQLASMPDPDAEEKQLKLDVLRSNLETDKYQRANIASQIDERNNVGGTGIDEKTMGKIQASPEYKTINGVLPALQALRDYKDAINKYGTANVFGGEGKGTLSGTYGNAIAAWKTLAGLGALSGADFELAENAVPSTGVFKRSSTSLAKINASINNAINQAENLTRRLSQNYPVASENLTNQLDYMRVTAYPDKFKVGSDGLVYEITE